MKTKFSILIIILPVALFTLIGCNNSTTSSSSFSSSSIESSLSSSSSLTSQLTEKEFKGIIFNSKSFSYDGNAHSIYAENVPSFADVKYVNNDKINAGSYSVNATISAEGYKTKTLSATLTILAREFSDITFNDKTFTYDGEYHSIYVDNLPSFATATYSNNNKCQTGSYVVTAIVKADNYRSKTLSATMKIVKRFPAIHIPNRTLIYDQSSQRIDIDLSSYSLPFGTTITYKVDDVAMEIPTVKGVGTHTFSLILSNEKYGYETATYNATIKVVEQTIGGCDLSKTPFIFTNDLKYASLKEEILKRNFTVKVILSDDVFYPDGTTKSTISSTTTYYVDDLEAFVFYDLYDKKDNIYDVTETYVTHSKVIGDNVWHAKFVNGLLNESECTKMDKSLYEENYISQYGLKAMCYLNKGAEGEIIDGIEGGYTTRYATHTIDTINNIFTMETRNHYYHEEFNHDEVAKYEIYNVGNTSVNMIDDFDVSYIEQSKFKSSSFILNGIKYYNGTADVSFDALDCTYVSKGKHTLLAIANDINITKITYEYYASRYGHDLTGYEIDTYFNNNGIYQDKYSSIGYVTDYKKLYSLFVASGGTIKYYGEW